MPEYIAIMSECDFTILEEIFEDKYKKISPAHQHAGETFFFNR